MLASKCKKKVKESSSTGNDQFRHGQIYYMKDKSNVVGSEQAGYRPVVIVSANACNASFQTVEIVPLTTRDKHAMPTHVLVNSVKIPSIALCEQIQTADKKSLFRYIGNVSRKEMRQIAHALSISIGLVGTRLRESEKMLEGAICRGKLYSFNSQGKSGERAVVVVSNNVGNHFSTIAEVVPLMAGEMHGSPTYTPVSISGVRFTALCGKIQTVDKGRLSRYIGTVPLQEMVAINHAMAVGLGMLAEGEGKGDTGNRKAKDKVSA